MEDILNHLTNMTKKDKFDFINKEIYQKNRVDIQTGEEIFKFYQLLKPFFNYDNFYQLFLIHYYYNFIDKSVFSEIEFNNILDSSIKEINELFNNEIKHSLNNIANEFLELVLEKEGRS